MCRPLQHIPQRLLHIRPRQGTMLRSNCLLSMKLRRPLHRLPELRQLLRLYFQLLRLRRSPVLLATRQRSVIAVPHRCIMRVVLVLIPRAIAA